MLVVEEYNSLMKKKTWNLVPQSKPKNVENCIWVYETNITSDVVERHKDLLVVKGFSELEGIEYTNTFSLVTKMNYVKIILLFTAHFGWEVHQMDVKSAFLHGDLTKNIYMEQPPHFEKDDNLVCQLKKSLYGLKQTSKARYDKIDRFFLDFGFKHCELDHGIYVLHVNDATLIVALYVDDLHITRSTANFILGFKKRIKNTFEMTNLGLLHFFLGIQASQMDDDISLST
jgi:hypothetical protein